MRVKILVSVGLGLVKLLLELGVLALELDDLPCHFVELDVSVTEVVSESPIMAVDTSHGLNRRA